MCYILVFVNDTPSTQIYAYGHTLSLHDARPFCRHRGAAHKCSAALIFDDFHADPLRPMTMPRPVYGGADGLLRRSGRPTPRSGNLTAIPQETALSFASELARSGSIMARPSPYRHMRSEEIRVGKECVRPCSSRW